MYRPHVFHHQCRIGLPDGAADGGDQLIGRQVRADDDVHRVHPQHGGRHIDLGRCRPVQAVVAHVADDADDLEAVVVGCAEARRGADRIASGPVRARGGFVDHDGRRIALLAVGLVQQPAGAKRDPHRRKEVRCGPDGAHALSESIGRPALDVDGGVAAKGTGWQLARERGARHAGRLPQRVHQPRLRRTPLLGTFLRCAGASRQGEVERDEAVGVEAQRHAFEIAHVNDENGRRRQEREGEGDFGDDERLRQASRRRGG